MSKIKIMCTSTGCIEYAPERYRNLGIEIIRIHVFFEGKEYREGLDLDPVEFYKRLETLEHGLCTYVGNGGEAYKGCHHNKITRPAFNEEEGDYISHQPYYLGSGVKAVDYAVAGKILAESYVLQHCSSPSLRFMSSLRR